MASSGLNKVSAIGNLGSDPEIRYVPSGAAVASFNVAVNEEWTDKTTGERRSNTEWISVETWGGTAEACSKYLRRGSRCYIEGPLKTDKWVDKESGQNRSRQKVRAYTVIFLDKPSQQTDAPPQTPTQPTQPTQPSQPTQTQLETLDDDIPF